MEWSLSYQSEKKRFQEAQGRFHNISQICKGRHLPAFYSRIRYNCDATNRFYEDHRNVTLLRLNRY